jgi:KDO2-lipid IV(A) lauroyltransferase
MIDPTRRPLAHCARDMALAGLVYTLYGLFAILPVDAASALGGRIARTIGPRLAVSRRATHNLIAAFPDTGKIEIASIVTDMWESLGRTAGEIPHIERLTQNLGTPDARIDVVGIENISGIPDGQPVVCFGGHLANWELILRMMANLGYPCSAIFRNPNNPYLESLLRRIRTIPGVDMVPKGAAGARSALAILSRGSRLVMLADQKLNDGIAVPFFGRDAMTAPALARFALRYNCPIVPIRVERLDGARFRFSIGEPLDVPTGDDSNLVVDSIMRNVNSILESWIRDRPAQWLWLHNRWPS